MTTWTSSQLKTFLESVRDDRLYALWLLYATTGMRRGEALALYWEDIDFEAGRVAVQRALVPLKGRLEISEPKTPKARRSIALDAGTAGALRAPCAAARRTAGPRDCLPGPGAGLLR
jgi:integrase